MKKLATLAALAGALSMAASSTVLAAENMAKTDKPMQADTMKKPMKAAEGKCGEGKCGADHKDGKMMDGKKPMKAAEGKCGEGKCGSK